MIIDDIAILVGLYPEGLIAGGMLSGIVFIIAVLISGFISWVNQA